MIILAISFLLQLKDNNRLLLNKQINKLEDDIRKKVELERSLTQYEDNIIDKKTERIVYVLRKK